MRASVIISTYNGANKIACVLNAVLAQLPSEVDVIVSDDGSSDNTGEIVGRFQKQNPSVKYLFNPNGGRSAVRNRGAAKATGDVLIFYDDDMEPLEGSVLRHIQFHETQRGLCVGNLVEHSHSKNHDVVNYKAWLVEGWMAKYRPGLNRLNLDNLFFSAANSSIRKADFLTLGGFDERLRDNEDYDLALRALEMEIPIYLDKENSAVHHDRITVHSYIKRLKEYQKGKSRLITFNSVRYSHFTSVMQKESDWKSFVYKFLSKRFFVSLIDKQLLKVLPKLARYKIYSAVIHAAVKNDRKIS